MVQTSFRYIKGSGITVAEQLADIFSSFKPRGLTIRMVFFGNALNNEEYLKHLEQITHSMRNQFGKQLPGFSYVAQSPLERNQMVAEVYELEHENDVQVYYKQLNDFPYIIIETPKTKSLYLGGAKSDPEEVSIKSQSDSVFSKLEEVFRIEKMPVSSIVRQWNYIEQITKTTKGQQNYQVFNDSRTRFYKKTIWNNGYPAATGVGTSCAGVMVDLDAFHSIGADKRVYSLNNSLQVPAHAYSATVLYGEEGKLAEPKTTPKFERAKLVVSDDKGLIYISGTAAIRGELSLENVEIEEQTRITIENIEHLISEETLYAAGIRSAAVPQVCALRIYLKDPSFYEKSREIVSQKYNGVPSVYLMADVCRNELLIEIEGIARLGG